MEKQAIFKSSINGFEKTAVLQYIDEMSQEASKKQQELQAKVEELSRANQELEEKAKAAE